MLFEKKHAKENKVIDLSALPPCRNVLRIHSERANFFTKVWRSALKNKINEESFTIHGWVEYSNISGVFFSKLFDDEQYDFGSDNEESEDENKN